MGACNNITLQDVICCCPCTQIANHQPPVTTRLGPESVSVCRTVFGVPKSRRREPPWYWPKVGSLSAELQRPPIIQMLAMRECGDRIRRERASPTSPRLVLRRVLVLSEGRQFREAAAVLQRLGAATIAAVAGDIPLDLLVEGLPHSAQLLDTLFNKWVPFYWSDGDRKKDL